MSNTKVSVDFGTFDEGHWKGSTGNFPVVQELKLGPGQRKPRNYHLNTSKYGELFLEFNTLRSHLEMKVTKIHKNNSFYNKINYLLDFGNQKFILQLH